MIPDKCKIPLCVEPAYGALPKCFDHQTEYALESDRPDWLPDIEGWSEEEDTEGF